MICNLAESILDEIHGCYSKSWNIKGALTALMSLDEVFDSATSECPFNIRFTHSSISNRFRNGGLLDNAIQDIQAGRLMPDAFPPLEVVARDGCSKKNPQRNYFTVRRHAQECRVQDCHKSSVLRNMVHVGGLSRVVVRRNKPWKDQEAKSDRPENRWWLTPETRKS